MGTHRDTGERLEGLNDVRQSVEEILRTPLRTRPMDPTFGTDLLAHVDRPMNGSGRAKLYAATAGAIARHEPRVKVDQARLTADELGEVAVEVEATSRGEGIVAGSIPRTVDEARRCMEPYVYFERGDYSVAANEWLPEVGGTSLVALWSASALLDVDGTEFTDTDNSYLLDVT